MVPPAIVAVMAGAAGTSAAAELPDWLIVQPAGRGTLSVLVPFVEYRRQGAATVHFCAQSWITKAERRRKRAGRCMVKFYRSRIAPLSYRRKRKARSACAAPPRPPAAGLIGGETVNRAIRRR
jgi:hypothetical protein